MKLIRHPSRCFYIKHPRSIRYHTKRPKGPEQFGGRSMLWWPTTFLATEPYKYIVYLFIHSIIEIYTIFWIKWYQAHLFMSMQSRDIQCFMSMKKHNVSGWRFYTIAKKGFFHVRARFFTPRRTVHTIINTRGCTFILLSLKRLSNIAHQLSCYEKYCVQIWCHSS